MSDVPTLPPRDAGREGRTGYGSSLAYRAQIEIDRDVTSP